MQGDFTRDTFDPLRHFSRVLMQQGRVQLDADWNEQMAILLHYVQTLAKDLIGPHGGPEDGFKIDTVKGSNVTNDFVISRGRYYVDGILCELEGTPIPIRFLSTNKVEVSTCVGDHREFQIGQYVEIFAAALPPGPPLQCKISDVDPKQRQLTLAPSIEKFKDVKELQLRRITTYLTQPDYPSPDPIKFQDNQFYLVYLDVWERHISYLEDEGDLNIREVALGGPDTATRTKVVWQVKVMPTDGIPPADIPLAVPQPTLSHAYLCARAKQEQPQSNPCVMQPEARYRGAENQLYRVEIHTGGEVQDATFKWSRENASVVYPIISLQGTTATLASLGRDKHLSLTVGDWVEIVDDDRTLCRKPGLLVQVDVIEPTVMTVTFKAETLKAETLPVYLSDSDKHPLLRRWDYRERMGDTSTLHGKQFTLSTDNAIPISESDEAETAHWFVLEDGVQIQFLGQSPQDQPRHKYCTGDYWLIPARTATGEVEWPREEEADQTSPQGRAKAMLPHGVDHHYAPLAVISVNPGGSIEVEHFRRVISPAGLVD
jgi:hypothetical protein